jgi:hypothetical protein
MDVERARPAMLDGSLRETHDQRANVGFRQPERNAALEDTALGFAERVIGMFVGTARW